MAVFLNKKEQVIKLKLTNYGHYLFSIGSFKPEYYAFYDDNIIYDSAYMGISESQNYTIKRIKEDTQYIESLVLFADAEKEVAKAPNELVNFFEVDVTPTRKIPRKDIFKFDKALGDAFLDGPGPDYAPAWKVVALNGEITSVTERDEVNNLEIPQINIRADYGTMLIDNKINYSPETLGDIIDTTPTFSDGKSIGSQAEDFMFYVEEINTELLNENFEVEIFQIMTGSNDDNTGPAITSSLERKYFQSPKPQIVDGMMVSDRPHQLSFQKIPKDSVEYYFDFKTDQAVNQEMACKMSQFFNRQSYYVDLDFDCEEDTLSSVYFDIYGSEIEPEICLD